MLRLLHLMADKLKKIWNWLNGKKLIIGGIGSVAIYGIRKYVPDYTVAYMFADIAQYAFGVFTAIGAGHKVQKKFLPGGLAELKTKFNKTK